MRSLRSRSRGLSEIVGTLMLVLIVVAAATAFSLFVAQYQRQLQSEQNFVNQKNLESLHVLRVTPTIDGNGTAWASLNFTVSSTYVEPSTLTHISVNSAVLEQYNAWRLNLSTGAYQWVTVSAGGQLTLGPREQLNLLVNLSAGPSFSFYDPSFRLPTTSFVKVELITYYQNDFSRLFIPPTANPVVTTLQTWNGAQFVTEPVLDGSNSFQPGSNSTIVSWVWAVTTNASVATYTGEKVVVPMWTGVPHPITLTVTDSDGLIGIGTTHYP